MNYQNIPCAVTADLNRYLSQLEREDARDAAIEERLDELLSEGAEFYPADPANIAEALSEIQENELGPVPHHMASIVKAKHGEDLSHHYEMIGRHFSAAVIAYLTKYGTNRAETDVDNREPDFDEPERDDYND